MKGEEMDRIMGVKNNLTVGESNLQHLMEFYGILNPRIP